MSAARDGQAAPPPRSALHMLWEIPYVLGVTAAILFLVTRLALQVYFKNVAIRPGVRFLGVEVGGTEVVDLPRQLEAVVEAAFRDPILLEMGDTFHIVHYKDHFKLAFDVDGLVKQASVLGQDEDLWDKARRWLAADFPPVELPWRPVVDREHARKALARLVGDLDDRRTYAFPTEDGQVRLVVTAAREQLESILDQIEQLCATAPQQRRKHIVAAPVLSKGEDRIVAPDDPEFGFKAEVAKLSTRFYEPPRETLVNAAKALEKLHGLMINPGEVFDLGAAIGPYTTEAGYVGRWWTPPSTAPAPVAFDEYGRPVDPAPVRYDEYGAPIPAAGAEVRYDEYGRPIPGETPAIRYDEYGRRIPAEAPTTRYDEYGNPLPEVASEPVTPVLTDVGLGVDQVASTALQALVRAGLRIKARTTHQHFGKDLRYTQPGWDVRLLPDPEDPESQPGRLVMENPWEMPVRLTGELSPAQVAIRVHSLDALPGAVDIRVGVPEKIPYKTELVQDPTLERGAEVVDRDGVDGYRVKIYRKVMWPDGRETREKLLGGGVIDYAPRPSRIRLGTGEKVRAAPAWSPGGGYGADRGGAGWAPDRGASGGAGWAPDRAGNGGSGRAPDRGTTGGAAWSGGADGSDRTPAPTVRPRWTPPPPPSPRPAPRGDAGGGGFDLGW